MALLWRVAVSFFQQVHYIHIQTQVMELLEEEIWIIIREEDMRQCSMHHHHG